MTKTERVQLRLSPETKDALRAVAEAEGRSITNYIEWLIRQDLDRRKEATQ